MPQRLRNLLESFGPASATTNATGQVTNVDTLLASDALGRLDESHPGIYALVVFDADVDKEVAAYLSTDAPSSDTGSHIFLLYEARPLSRRTVVTSPVDVKTNFGNPLFEFARARFPDVPIIAPGLLFLDSLASPTSALYVSLIAGSKDELVPTRFRQALGVAGQVVARCSDRSLLGETLGLGFAKAGLPYVKSGKFTAAEHVARLIREIWKSKKDLLAFVPVVGKLLSLGKSDA